MSENIKRLARALQDQQITPEQLADLEAELAQNAEARETYLREVNLYAALEERAVTRNDSVLETNGVDRAPASRVSRWLVLAGWPLAIAAAILAITGFFFSRPSRDAGSIATVVGLSGPMQWTGDGGRVDHDLRVGMELRGGTIEGMAPDSWFELRFEDGSTVMISGTSLLTFAEIEHKELRLREGRFSANVVPQPEGKPMLIHTRTALLKVLGTQFDIEADLASTSLNVSEGKVRVQRLSDRREVDVPSQHRVVAAYDHRLEPERMPKTVDHWISQLGRQPGGYGKWLPATKDRVASQRAIPMVPAEFPHITLY
ncbi:MAG: FecR family protein, partial [Planctomycetota bacterium]